MEETVFDLEQNSAVTLTPSYPPPGCGSKRCRWHMHIALPFVLPSNKCISEESSRSGFRMKMELHNHYDRLTRFRLEGSGTPSVFRAQKLDPKAKEPPCPAGLRQSRDFLQSVAVFEEPIEY